MTSSVAISPRAERVATTLLPTRHGTFSMLGYLVDGVELVALGVGLDAPPEGVLPWVRIHSECLTGDAFGSLRCDCGEQLQAALAAIMDHGYGAVIYARGHEGRGIGLLEKLKAYALQDAGLDTLDANLALGHPGDARRYDAAASVMIDLGLTRVEMLSSNPTKAEAVADFGIQVVRRLRLGVPDRPENVFYLNTKRARMRHDSVPTEVIPASGLSGAPAEVYDSQEALGPQFVIAQLGQSLDGFIATRTGDSSPLTGSEDHRHLHRLRSLVDAVVVGASTVIADNCRLTVREVPGNNPVRVVLDPRGVVPASSSVLADAEAATVWVVGSSVVGLPEVGGHVRVLRLPVIDLAAPSVGERAGRTAGGAQLDGRAAEPSASGPQGFAPASVVKALLDLGLGRLLIEGGGRLVSAFVDARAVDRLFVTVAPILIGDGVPGIRFAGADAIADSRRGRPRSFRLGADVCMELNLRAPV